MLLTNVCLERSAALSLPLGIKPELLVLQVTRVRIV